MFIITTIITTTIISKRNQMVRLIQCFCFWFLNQGDQGPQVFTILRGHLQMVGNPNLKGPEPVDFSRCWCHHPKGSSDKSARPFFLPLSPPSLPNLPDHLSCVSCKLSLKLSQPQVSSADMTSQNLEYHFLFCLESRYFTPALVG